VPNKPNQVAIGNLPSAFHSIRRVAWSVSPFTVDITVIVIGALALWVIR
jgi:hypothetical protein